MDRLANYEHTDLREASLYSAPPSTYMAYLTATYASFEAGNLPTHCPTCNVALTDPLHPE